MLLESQILGIFGDGGSDFYDDISVDVFKENYEKIVSDLNGQENQQEATRAFAEIASDYPRAVEDNGKTLYRLCESGKNAQVQLNSMIALVEADFALDGELIGDKTVSLLNEMLAHDNPDVRETCSILLMRGARDYGYSVNGKYANEGLKCDESVMTRLRSAQALRFYCTDTGDYGQVGICGNSIKNNLRASFGELDNEYWFEIAKEMLRLTGILIQVNEDVSENIPFIIDKVVETKNSEIIEAGMHMIEQLPRVNPEIFLQIEPTIRKMISPDYPDSRSAYAIAPYKVYSGMEDAKIKEIQDVAKPVFEYYKSIDTDEYSEISRIQCAVLLRNLSVRGAELNNVMEEIGEFERELKDSLSRDSVLATLDLYLDCTDTVGFEPIKGRINYVEKYLQSDDERIQEAAATLLMRVANQDKSELEKNGVNMNRLKRVLENTYEDVDSADQLLGDKKRNENKHKTDSGTDNIEHKYLTGIPDTDFSDYIGMNELKREAKRKIIEPLKNPELHEEFGVDIQRGFLFYGPPGTGKTYFAKSLAGEFELSYMEIDAADLVTKWIGEGAKNVGEMFDVAMEHEPCLIFIDEIDAIASDRSDVQQTKSERQMVNQLLQSISRLNDEEKEVVVIGATNRIDDVDSAILRSGRLGTKIEFTEPNPETRVEIFRHHCKPDTSKIEREWLKDITDGMVQSDLTELANKASYNALERYKRDQGEKRITEADVSKAVERMRNDTL